VRFLEEGYLSKGNKLIMKFIPAKRYQYSISSDHSSPIISKWDLKRRCKSIQSAIAVGRSVMCLQCLLVKCTKSRPHVLLNLFLNRIPENIRN
jgi:hypothetical protein